MNYFDSERPRKSFFVRKISLPVVLVILAVTVACPKRSTASVAATVSSPFSYNFTVGGSLVETANQNNSSSPYWVINSGGRMILSGGRGQTLQGSLPSSDFWRTLYAQNNPLDTDNGYHPQNIFRLVGRSKWADFRQQVYFKITRDQLSASPNRNASNGVLLFNRYKDQDNLYYTGLRVDGYAVIKKKVGGTYHTLSHVKIFPGTYNSLNKPNLLPKNTWLGVRSEVKDNSNGTVSIKLFTDIGWRGQWKLVAETTDNGSAGSTIKGEGYGGIRTDFMDVVFDQYRMENI